ncbi:M14 family zinc carboxypeptidase [Stackebrandtia nassauensis]|uniref:M14 family zinc carboxypeptidase n=1 Tax=Stackebrandtia nassauensis TaxID=283811 RepID=UPI0001A3A85C
MRTAVATATAVALSLAVLSAASGTATADDLDTEPAYLSVPGLSGAQTRALSADGFDVVKRTADGATTVIGDAKVADRLRDRGLEPTVLDTVYKKVSTKAALGEYYGGYKTPDLHFKHLDDVAAAHPDLAKVYDIGDSWLKTQGQGGHDIKAICITKMADGDCELSPESAKPRFSVISQIHAREIATGEISWRWIDYLANGYGSDETVTSILDTTEVWVVPIVNPDGVDKVASGGDSPLLQRKNLDNSHGDCGGTQTGVDLNRNHSYGWGDAGTQPCSETFQGPSAGSEPEIVAVEEFFGKIHPDQRGDGDAPAPDDTRDVMISLHSYGEYLIVPWGHSTSPPPNDSQLRALGNAMAESNGYQVGNPSQTVGYLASGTSDDYTYGTLGIASYTFEVGGQFGECGGFLPAYSCVEDLWTLNQGALITAAQNAKAPYQL